MGRQEAGCYDTWIKYCGDDKFLGKLTKDFKSYTLHVTKTENICQICPEVHETINCYIKSSSNVMPVLENELDW